MCQNYVSVFAKSIKNPSFKGSDSERPRTSLFPRHLHFVMFIDHLNTTFAKENDYNKLSYIRHCKDANKQINWGVWLFSFWLPFCCIVSTITNFNYASSLSILNELHSSSWTPNSDGCILGISEHSTF